MTSTSLGHSEDLPSGRRSGGRGKRTSAPARRRRRAPSPPRELREAGLAARKSLGQHFLTSHRFLRRIADAAELSPSDTVIEVGAGLGSLTVELAARAGRVLAIELDEALAGYLRRRFADTNVLVVHGDALAMDPAEALSQAGASGSYVVAGNLPYYVAQPLLRYFLEAKPAPRRLVVMVQAEVAESIVAQPGEMSLLSVSIQLYGQPRLLFFVPPSAFYPRPKVRSAVISIDVAPQPRASVDDTKAFFRVARAGFGTRRKQLRNALTHGLRIDTSTAAELLTIAGIDRSLRAQALSLEQWAALARAWDLRGRPEGTK